MASNSASATSSKLYNLECRSVSYVQSSNTIQSITIDDSAYQVQIPITDSISYQDENLVLELRKINNGFTGTVVENGVIIRVFAPISTTYQLATSSDEQNYSSGDTTAVDSSIYTEWKQLKLAFYADQDSALTVDILFNGTHVNSSLVNNSITLDGLGNDESISFVHLLYDNVNDSLSGYYKRGTDVQYKIKGTSLKDYTSTPFLTFDSKLSLSDLESLTSWVDETTDQAQVHSKEAFQKLMMSSMEEKYVKKFFGQNKPQLDVGLHEILYKKDIQGQKPATDFYNFYSTPLVSKGLQERADPLLKDFKLKPDKNRLDNYLQREVQTDVNYQNQTQLLYLNGYKKAVAKIESYIQDQQTKGFPYWAQRLFYHNMSLQKMKEMGSIFESAAQNSPQSLQKTLSTWSTKFELLGGKVYSKRLISSLLMYSGATAANPSQYLDEDYNLNFQPDDQDRQALQAVFTKLAEESGDDTMKSVVDFMTAGVQFADTLLNFAYICYSFRLAGTDTQTMRQILDQWSNVGDKSTKSILRQLIPEEKAERYVTYVAIGGQVTGILLLIISGCIPGYLSDTLSQVTFWTNVTQTFITLVLQVLHLASTVSFARNAHTYITGPAGNLMEDATLVRGLVFKWNMPPTSGKPWDVFKYKMTRPAGWIELVTFLGCLASAIISIFQFKEAQKSGDQTLINLYGCIIGFSFAQSVTSLITLFADATKIIAPITTIIGGLCSLVVMGLSFATMIIEAQQPDEDVVTFSSSETMKCFVAKKTSEISKPTMLLTDETLDNGNYTLKLSKTNLYVLDNSNNTQRSLVTFNSCDSPAVSIQFNQIEIVDTSNDQNKSIASIAFTNKPVEVPTSVVLKLLDNGQVSVVDQDQKQLLLV